MSDFSTADCKKFLDEELKLSSSAWKRTSKKKNEQGEWVRELECTKNNLKVYVVESDGVLFLDSQSPLSALSNTSTQTQSGTKTKSKSSNSSSVSKALKDLETILVKWNWGGFAYHEIQNNDNKEDYSMEPEQLAKMITKAANQYYALSDSEKAEFTKLSKDSEHDLITLILSQTGECVNNLNDLDETYIPHHLGRDFTDYQIGLIQMADLVEDLAKTFAANSIPLSQAAHEALHTTAETIAHVSEYALDYAEDEQPETIKEIEKRWAGLKNDLAVKAEKFGLEKQVDKAKSTSSADFLQMSAEERHKQIKKILKL